MKAIRNIFKRFQYFYFIYREIMKRREERRLFLEDAIERFGEGTAKHGTLADYKRALYQQGFFYSEYSAYKLWDMDEKRGKEFISSREMHCIYRKTVQINVGRCYIDKVSGIETFKRYVHRKWVNPESMTFDAFKEFVLSMKCIAKPRYGTQGQDVFLIKDKDESSLKVLYQFCCENSFIVEEYLRACKEIEEFHPSSLNTVRVMTMSNFKTNKVEVLDAELRMGVHDSVVDNAHQGGVLASIDVETGMLKRNGVDTFGNEYVTHPDSGKSIKGFVIPQWNEIVRVCKEASFVVPETIFAGWDICVRQDGEIEIIEVNAFPVIIGLQTSSQRGLKPRLKEVGERVLGYNPLKLISVWRKSAVRFEGKYGHYF